MGINNWKRLDVSDNCIVVVCFVLSTAIVLFFFSMYVCIIDQMKIKIFLRFAKA